MTSSSVLFQVEFPVIVLVKVIMVEYAATGDVTRSYQRLSEYYRMILYGSPRLLRDWRENDNRYSVVIGQQASILITLINCNLSMDK